MKERRDDAMGERGKDRERPIEMKPNMHGIANSAVTMKRKKSIRRLVSVARNARMIMLL